MSYGRAQDHSNGLLCLLIAVEYDLRVLIEGGDSYFSTIPKRKKKWKESFTDNYLQYFQTCIFAYFSIRDVIFLFYALLSRHPFGQIIYLTCIQWHVLVRIISKEWMLFLSQLWVNLYSPRVQKHNKGVNRCERLLSCHLYNSAY